MLWHLVLLLSCRSTLQTPARAAETTTQPAAVQMVRVGDMEINAAAFGTADTVDQAVAVCGGCHGDNGAGDADFGPDAAWGTPDLRGLSEQYMAQQLRAYRDGKRRHAEMGAIAALLNDADIDRLSTHYAQNGLPQGRAVSASTVATPETMAHGKRLAEQGVSERGIVACDSCHGTQGSGNGDLFPKLRGQNATYLRAALQQMKADHRDAPNTAIMVPIADALSNEDVEAVARYYEGFLPR